MQSPFGAATSRKSIFCRCGDVSTLFSTQEESNIHWAYIFYEFQMKESMTDVPIYIEMSSFISTQEM